jgi:hypothetical protein
MRVVLALALILVVLMGFTLPASLAADENASASIEKQVAEQLKGKIPDQHLPEYQAFTRKCVAALTGVKRMDAQTAKVIAYSIVLVALDYNKRAAKTDATKLKERLDTLLQEHKNDLAAVTDELLHRDWDALRKDIERDGRTVRELFRKAFSERPVLVLAQDLNWAAAAGLDELPAKGHPTRSDWQRLSDADLKRAALSARIEKLVFLRVDEMVGKQVDRGADYVGTIFLMREIHYCGSLGEKQRATIRQRLDKTFLVDQTAVIASSAQIGGAVADIRQLLFYEKPLSAGPSEFIRMQLFKEAFDRLKEQAPSNGTFPLSFGKPVPEELRSGKRFEMKRPGAKDPATLQKEMERLKERDEMEQLLMVWLGRLSSLVKYKDRLAGDLLLSFTERWKKKVLDLQEFFGNRIVEESSFSPLEKAMLGLLRQERKTIPYFTETNKPRRTRMDEYEKALFHKPPPSHIRLAADMQCWLDAEYKRKITPEMALAWRYKVRAYELLDFLHNDIMAREKITIPSDQSETLYQLVQAFWKKFDQVGVYKALGERLSDKQFALQTPLGQTLYEYYYQALAHNPVLQNMDAKIESHILWNRYRAYSAKGRPEAEQQAYDKAIAGLTVAMKAGNLRWNDPPSPFVEPPATEQKQSPEAPARYPDYLRADPRLQVKITLNLGNPSLEELLGQLRQSTGVRLIVGHVLANHQPSFGHVHFVDAPAWEVLEFIAQRDLVGGEWDKIEGGYGLEGESTAPRRNFSGAWWWGGIPLFVAVVALVVSAVVFYHRRPTQDRPL